MTPWGVYEWLVLPMGLKTALAQYQRMVQWCLEQDKRISAKAYIDDVLAGTSGPPPIVQEVPPDPQNPSGGCRASGDGRYGRRRSMPLWLPSTNSVAAFSLG